LRALLEEVWQRGAPLVGLESVLLVDADPRQLLPSPRQLVAAPRKLLLGFEQFQPGSSPLLARHNLVSSGQWVVLNNGHNIFLSLLVLFSNRFKKDFRIKVSTCLGLGLAHGAHLAAAGTAAVEDTRTVGLEAGDGHTCGHLEALKDFTR